MRKLLHFILTLFVGFYSQSQNPQTSATLDMTLQCTGGTNNRTGIAFNPNQQLYYSVNAGTTGYPIETFDVTGNPVASVAQGFDYRGAWWNPNTSVLEGNGFSNNGIWIQDLDASFYALGSGTNDVTGSGPDAQSSANYDPVNDEVIHYFDGQIYSYDRLTYNLVTTTAITGLPVAFSNLNSNSVAYTGVSGMEIGVYDYSNTAFYFINKANGAYVMTCELPVSAPSPTQFKMGFANGRLWLYNDVTSQWEGYITVSQCSETTSSISEVACSSYTVPSGNESYNTSGIYNDTILNVAGCDSVITIDLTINQPSTGTDIVTSCDTYTWIDGNIYTSSNNTATYTLTNAAGCDSVVTLDLTINSIDLVIINNSPILTASASPATFQWVDCGDSFNPIAGETSNQYIATTNGSYAVIITQNGCTDTTSCEIVDNVGLENNQLNNQVSLYPNPTSGKVTLTSLINIELIKVYNATGMLVLEKEPMDKEYSIDLSGMQKGVYLISIESAGRITTKKLVRQ